MKINYSFLNDELALLEIRKHKWIESQKQGKEIGFATAALDWINKYGEDFKIYRLGLDKKESIFSEKRQYRRFSYQFPIEVKIDDNSISGYTKDINIVGLSCSMPKYIPNNTYANIRINFKKSPNSKMDKTFQFKSKISRVCKTKSASSSLCYQIFLPFSENVRNFLRTQSPFSIKT